MTLDTYATFLTARWDEIEQAANVAAELWPGDWELYDRGWSASVQADEITGEDGEASFAFMKVIQEDRVDDPGRHLAHFTHVSPKAVLADLAAKRAILTSAINTAAAADAPGEDLGTRLVGRGLAEGFRLAIANLADPFRDHPDHPEAQ